MGIELCYPVHIVVTMLNHFYSVSNGEEQEGQDKKERYYFEDLIVGGGVILKWILK
jgi:hypothetical protein